MTPERWQESFREQLAILAVVGKVFGLVDDSPLGSRAAARTFAEDLILCLSEDEAFDMLLRRPAEARAFLQVAVQLDAQMSIDAGLRLHEPLTEPAAPFHVVAATVLTMLELFVREFPDVPETDWPES